LLAYWQMGQMDHQVNCIGLLSLFKEFMTEMKSVHQKLGIFSSSQQCM
jgi:hypothetical protein